MEEFLCYSIQNPYIITGSYLMPGIFINYRRADTQDTARKLYNYLRKQFGQDQVFYDVETIELGENFPIEVISTLELCDFCLVLIGNQWLTITDDNGKSRLKDPRDFVRREIEIALENGLEIIPVLVDGASMPSITSIPDTLFDVTRLNAQKLETKTLKRELERIKNRIIKVREAKRLTEIYPTEALNWVEKGTVLWQPDDQETLFIQTQSSFDRFAVVVGSVVHYQDEVLTGCTTSEPVRHKRR